jgi:YtoQ family protein
MEEITIYLAGEIHTDWRKTLERAVEARDIEARFVGPQTVHERSDSVGEDVIGEQPSPRYRDLMGAGINTLRTRVLMQRADLVVAYFGDKYRQWNTAADAGAALASGIPLLLVRDPSLTHALKEIDAMASATVETLEQAAEVIGYLFE